MSAATDILEQPRLAPEWQDWLAGSVVRGCVDADILAVMCENGFEANYARVAIAVVRSMTERVQQQAPAMLSGYRADPIRLPAVNRLEVEGHAIGIGFTIAMQCDIRYVAKAAKLAIPQVRRGVMGDGGSVGSRRCRA